MTTNNQPQEPGSTDTQKASVSRPKLAALGVLIACLAAGLTLLVAMASASDDVVRHAPLPNHIQTLQDNAADENPLPAHLQQLEAAQVRSTTAAQSVATQMNAICDENGRRFEAIGHPETLEEIAAMVPALRAAFDESIARIEDLEVEGSAAAKHNAFVALAREQSSLLHQMSRAAANADADALNLATAQMGPVAEASDAIAIELGASTCTTG